VNSVLVLAHPVNTSIGGMQAGPKLIAHSPTARVLGSTEGGGSLVISGLPPLGAGRGGIFVSWAVARAGKASAHSNVTTKPKVLLEDF
jgi:hypothetical protein